MDKTKYKKMSGIRKFANCLTLFISCFFVISTACKSGPTVDGTDTETFDASIATIRVSLLTEEKKKLDEVLKGFEYLYSDNVISTLNASIAIRNQIRNRLDGMDADDIFAEWNSRLEKAITILEEKKEATETAMQNLKEVAIRRAEYYTQRGQSVAKITIHNRTEHTISKVYFRGTLRSRVPRKWILEDDFNYNIRLTEGKDLAPDERAVWNFALLSPIWKKAPENVDNLYINVIVTRIDGAPEQPIYDAFSDRFTRKDSRRLRRLISLKESIRTPEPKGESFQN
tara:strand:+ start:829 stop:1683 length:855 start_codon:yes stop_codon:yes gene_type:complete